MSEVADPAFVARYHKVAIPPSPFLTETRIERLNAGEYEGPEARGALSVVKPSDRVLELGSGLGVVGAAVTVNCRPERMISYEANPALIPEIERLYALNGITHLISVRNRVLMAGDDRPESVTFHVNGKSFLGSGLQEDTVRNAQAVEVPTEAWEDARAELSPTVLVMDIEGAELDLLRHADLTGIRAVILEFHPGHYGKPGVREAKNILQSQGFAKHEDVSTRLVWTCSRKI